MVNQITSISHPGIRAWAQIESKSVFSLATMSQRKNIRFSSNLSAGCWLDKGRSKRELAVY